MAEKICVGISSKLPDITTTVVDVESRGNKLFVDFSQNDFADTVAAPYSARPNSKPIVSAPLEWKEVKRGLDPAHFTIQTIIKRLEKKGDLFAGVMDTKIAALNSKILEREFLY
jgi:bifunctional non-homologous end joining protein LigD